MEAVIKCLALVSGFLGLDLIPVKLKKEKVILMRVTVKKSLSNL